ncbi:MAG: hypothetical protein FD138_4323 [Planctomycetota bacterium]|nr:MAG: hypothetical protein FD138_4323 [Planctomycetota bacterium]
MSFILLSDAVANGEKTLTEDILYFVFTFLLMIPLLALLVSLMRRIRVSQDNMKRALAQNDEQLKLLSRVCEHSESSERHMAAIETKLDQIHDELKRRPLS